MNIPNPVLIPYRVAGLRNRAADFLRRLADRVAYTKPAFNSLVVHLTVDDSDFRKKVSEATELLLQLQRQADGTCAALNRALPFKPAARPRKAPAKAKPNGAAKAKR